MTLQRACLAAALAALVAPSVAIEIRGGGKIEPPLEPTSHKQFFDKDNAWDDRSGPTDFKYPFPTVQQSMKYDSDYVKDENSDGGLWSAQNDYDQLRAQLYRLQQKADACHKAGDDKCYNDYKRQIVELLAQLKDAESHLHLILNPTQPPVYVPPPAPAPAPVPAPPPAPPVRSGAATPSLASAPLLMAVVLALATSL